MSMVRDRLRQTAVYLGVTEGRPTESEAISPSARTSVGRLAASVVVKGAAFGAISYLLWGGTVFGHAVEGLIFGLLSTAVDEAIRRTRPRSAIADPEGGERPGSAPPA